MVYSTLYSRRSYSKPYFIEQERQLVESRALKSIAYLIFDALDYGNNYSNEPVLQSSLSHLLLLISGEFSPIMSHI